MHNNECPLIVIGTESMAKNCKASSPKVLRQQEGDSDEDEIDMDDMVWQ